MAIDTQSEGVKALRAELDAVEALHEPDQPEPRLEVESGPGSFRERIQRTRQKKIEDGGISEVGVPGFPGVLIRLGKVDYKDLHDTSLKVTSDDALAKLAATQDFLIRACGGFRFRDPAGPDDAASVSIAEEANREKPGTVQGEVLFHNAPEFLDLDVRGEGTARDKVLAVFSEADQPEFAILEVGMRHLAKLTGKADELDRALAEGF